MAKRTNVDSTADQPAQASEAKLVTGSNGRLRKPRMGDSDSVQCQKCSEDAGHPVYMAAYNVKTGELLDKPSNTITRYYKCPVCKLTAKRVNSQILGRPGKRHTTEDGTFSPHI